MASDEIKMTLKDVDTALFNYFNGITVAGNTVPISIYPPEVKTEAGKVYPSIEIHPTLLMRDRERILPNMREIDSINNTVNPAEVTMRERFPFVRIYQVHVWCLGPPENANELEEKVTLLFNEWHAPLNVINTETPPKEQNVWMTVQEQVVADEIDNDVYIYHRVWTIELEITLTKVESSAIKEVETTKWKFRQKNTNTDGEDRTTVVDEFGNESIEPY